MEDSFSRSMRSAAEQMMMRNSLQSSSLPAAPSFASLMHGLHSSKRVRYGVETEYKLAAEASTRVVAKVYEFSDYVQECSDEDDDDGSHLFSTSNVTEQSCTTENQLAAAVLKRAGGKFWINICPLPSSTTRGILPALTLEAALRLLQRHCGLQPYSVLDAMASTHRVKLDSELDSLYCSLLAFCLDPPMPGGSSKGPDPEGSVRKGSLRGGRDGPASLKQSLLPTRALPRTVNAPGKTSSQGYYSSSSGTLQDLVHQGIAPGTLANWKQPLAGGPVHWQRACFFLTSSSIISVFREPLGASGVASEIHKYFVTPEAYLMELAKGPAYLFYKLVEGVVQQLDAVLLRYRKQLLACEEITFKQDRVLQPFDLRQLQQLHLMEQELRVIRQQLVPTDGMLSTMVELTTKDQLNMATSALQVQTALSLQQQESLSAVLEGKGSLGSAGGKAPGRGSQQNSGGSPPGSDRLASAGASPTAAAAPAVRKLLNEETLDFLQEVQNDIAVRLTDTDELIGACKELRDLMSSIAVHRSSVSQRILAVAAAVFLPLLCLVGVFSTNFAILPGLTWGVQSAQPLQPPGYPLGYMFMLLLMAAMTCASLHVLRQQQVV